MWFALSLQRLSLVPRRTGPMAGIQPVYEFRSTQADQDKGVHSHTISDRGWEWALFFLPADQYRFFDIYQRCFS
ncbi:hypothetical protein A3194_06960 [Candidatus Thiodiazotropha endoloripes]|nr:hypothetical protein A3194_06960 [Candidatus Thiodiazotropha endoloripes]